MCSHKEETMIAFVCMVKSWVMCMQNGCIAPWGVKFSGWTSEQGNLNGDQEAQHGLHWGSSFQHFVPDFRLCQFNQ